VGSTCCTHHRWDPPAAPTIGKWDSPAVLAHHVIHHPIPNILYPENVTIVSADDMRRAIWANHVLGEGKTAKVYKGMLNGIAVAVKQIKNNSTLDLIAFLVRNIGQKI
jgi:hypothetical protein